MMYALNSKLLILISGGFIVSLLLTSLLQEYTALKSTISCHSMLLVTVRDQNKPCTFQEDQSRLSSCPFISGDTLRMVADWRYDETTLNISPQRIRPGDVIFVKTDFIQNFFTRFHPHIRTPYILITHNSDFSAPSKYADYLDDPNLAYWFAQNSDLTTPHPKFILIPIGLENRHWKSADDFEYFKSRATKPKPLDDRSTLLFVSLGNTNPNRARVIENVRRQNVTVNDKRLGFREYVDQVSNSKFVLSPPGNGLDCHRTWEALALGAIPIVQNSTINELYIDQNIVVLDDLATLDVSVLPRLLEKRHQSCWRTNHVWAHFWIDKIYDRKRDLQQ